MLSQAIVAEIHRDLSAFADPGTTLQGGPGGTLTWVRDRRERTARLQASGRRFPDVQIDGRTLSYEGFLASELLADLRDLALSIQTQIPGLPEFTAAPAAELTHTDTPAERPDAVELVVARSTRDLPFGSTRVLFIHGNAGAGKTALLRHMTRLQAERYLRGESATLLLYLDAQGKGLAQLEDVMARALQDLRAHFTYHCLAPLTRRGCVIPIVDGFDELIGPSSAREAFGNLAQFLSQLDCEGVVITSSRSAFVDYETLHARATEIAAAQGLSYEIYPIELLPWPDATVLSLARKRLAGSAEHEAEVKALLASDAGMLVKKPFFLSHICSILTEGGTVRSDQDLVSQVVQAALEREAGKLARAKPLLTHDQHRRFCQSLADEMWWQEKNELDCQTVRTIAEMFGEEAGLAPADLKMLVDRSIAHGLLTAVSGDTDRRAFEHELFRFEFQAGRLASTLLDSPEELRDYLIRRELPSELVERVNAHRSLTPTEVHAALAQIGALARSARSSAHGMTNAGTLATALLRSAGPLADGGHLEHLYFRGADLRQVSLKGWVIRDCVFDHADLRGTHLKACALEDSVFVACKLSQQTSLDATHVMQEWFAGIEWDQAGEVYSPEAIAHRLAETGAVLPPPAKPPTEALPPEVQARVTLAEKLLTHARSHFYLVPEQTWVRTQLLRDPAWAFVERALRAQKLMVDVQVNKSGPRETFWRLTVPADLIWRGRATPDRTSPEVAGFWRVIEGR